MVADLAPKANEVRVRIYATTAAAEDSGMRLAPGRWPITPAKISPNDPLENVARPGSGPGRGQEHQVVFSE